MLKSVAAVLSEHSSPRFLVFTPSPRYEAGMPRSVDASSSPQIASWRALFAKPLQVTSESDARGMSDMKLGLETC